MMEDTFSSVIIVSIHPNINVHVGAKHKKNIITCEICAYKSLSKVSFLFHMRSVHHHFQKNSKLKSDGQEQLCSKCVITTSLIQIKRHKCCNQLGRPPKSPGEDSIEINISKYKCNKCDFKTDIPTELRKHYDNIHSKINFRNKKEYFV